MIDVMLYEPDGTPNGMVSLAYAVDWCKRYPGWSWGYVSGKDHL